MEPTNAPIPERPDSSGPSIQPPVHQPSADQPSVDQPPAEGACRLSVDAVALDLVRAATDEGDDALVKTLLRSLVALGLTDAATFWVADTPVEATWPPTPRPWTQRRGFGGPTPAPTFEPAPLTSGAAWTLPFGEHGALVVRRETFDRDGLRDEREDQLESLVVLAETLLTDAGPLSPPPGLGSHGMKGLPGDTSGGPDGTGDQRRAG